MRESVKEALSALLYGDEQFWAVFDAVIQEELDEFSIRCSVGDPVKLWLCDKNGDLITCVENIEIRCLDDGRDLDTINDELLGIEKFIGRLEEHRKTLLAALGR